MHQRLTIVWKIKRIMLKTWSKEFWKEHKVKICWKQMWIEEIVGDNIIKIIENDEMTKAEKENKCLLHNEQDRVILEEEHKEYQKKYKFRVSAPSCGAKRGV